MSNYGYIEDIKKQAKVVVDCLGGGVNAYNLILETCATETGLGIVKDRTEGAGMGICQFDQTPFYDIRDRLIGKHRAKILAELNVDIKLVKWEHLRYNSYLSLIFCRLFYLLKPKAIPETLMGRAEYWKKYYNTYLGGGSVEHYIEMSEKYLYSSESRA